MFTILDGVLIAFILLSVFLGIKRGFIGSLVRLLGGFLRLVISILLAKPFVKLISLTRLDEHMFDKLLVEFSGYSEKFNVNLVGMQQEELNTFVSDALSDAKIPKVFRGLFVNLFSINPETISAKESVTLAELMGVAVVNIILLVCSFVLLMLILWFISKLISRWSKQKNKSNTIFARTNRWLGGVFGFLKCAIILFVGFIFISFISNFSFMEGVVNYINSSIFSKFLYETSMKLIDNSFNIKSIIENWLIN